MKRKFISSCYNLYTQFIYSQTRMAEYGFAHRAVVAERERGLGLKPRDGKGCCDLLRLARTRRRDVIRGDGVGRLAGGGP